VWHPGGVYLILFYLYITMYFDIEPKEKKEDLFGFEDHYNDLKEAINGRHKLIVIKGLRRTGKTSLMNVVFNECSGPKLYIDARELEENETPSQFFLKRMIQYAKKESMLETIFSFVESIEFGITINMRRQAVMLSDILRKTDEEMKKKNRMFVIFIDEAQLFKKYGFEKFLAFMYDRLHFIKVVLAGSEIGLMDDFIGEKADSPLFGRVKKIVETKRLKREESEKFLLAGFRQAGKKPDEKEIKEAVDKLDGIIGWLTYYGFSHIETGHEESLKKVMNEGSKIVSEEINNFLKSREVARKKYLWILEALSTESIGRKEIKNYLAVHLGKKISDAKLSIYLDSLMRYGFVEKTDKDYFAADPLTKEAVRKIMRAEK